MGDVIGLPVTTGGAAGAAGDGAAAAGTGDAAGAGLAAATLVPVAEIRTERPFDDSSSSPIPVLCTSRIRRRSSRSSKPATTAESPAALTFAGPGTAVAWPTCAATPLGFALRAAERPPRDDFTLARGMAREVLDETAQGEPVALDAEAGNRSERHPRDERWMPECFARLRIGH